MTTTMNHTDKHCESIEALKACELQLREYVRWHHANAGGCSVEIESAWEQGRDAIANAESVSSPDSMTMRLLKALEAVLPYAENEGHSLYECWRRDDDAKVKEHSDVCQRIITEAHAVLACVQSAYGLSVAATADQPVRFGIEQDMEENPDRVYVMVDGKFEVAIIRTDEGVVVDVYPKDGMEPIATTYAFDSELGGCQE